MSERKYTRLSVLISEAEVGLRFLSFVLWTTGSLSLYCWQPASFSVFSVSVFSIFLVKENKGLEGRNPIKKFCKGDVLNKNEVTEGPNIVKYHLSLFLDFRA